MYDTHRLWTSRRVVCPRKRRSENPCRSSATNLDGAFASLYSTTRRCFAGRWSCRSSESSSSHWSVARPVPCDGQSTRVHIGLIVVCENKPMSRDFNACFPSSRATKRPSFPSGGSSLYGRYISPTVLRF